MKKVIFILIFAMVYIFSMAAFAIGASTERGLLKVDVGENGSLSCYIVGIPEEKMDEISARVQSAFPDVNLEDPVLIDAEKKTILPDQEDENCDSLLCWAASISNMLWATNWGANMTNPLTHQSFTSEDDLMQYFIQSFSDGCNNMDYGLQWIFNGVSRAEKPPGFGWAQLKRDHNETDAFFPQYSALNLITQTAVDYSAGNISALDSLTKGAAVTVSLQFCSESIGYGDSHAVTAMGVIVDPAAKGSDTYYKYILLANSDDCVEGYEGTPADQRPNRIDCYPLRVKRTSFGEKVWEVVGYSQEDGYYTRIKTIYSLAPFESEAAEAAIETDPQATKDALNTPDIVLDCVFTSLRKGTLDSADAFEYGSRVWLNITVMNESYVNCEESYTALITLTRESDGEMVSFYTDCNSDKELYQLEARTDSVRLNDYMAMKSGRYRVSVELNPASAVSRLTEAYYLNNRIFTLNFDVKAQESMDDDADDDDLGASGCILTFHTNGGSVISRVSEIYGKVIDLDMYVPARDGYVFVGWYSDRALTSPIDRIKLNSNQTVYAKWEKQNPGTAHMDFPFTNTGKTGWIYDDAFHAMLAMILWWL